MVVSPTVFAEKSLTQHGITWAFDKDVKAGTFANGDYWVVGPVNVVGITTDLHAEGFTQQAGEDGSMVNPGTDSRQGYDRRLNSYDENLNAGLAGGTPAVPGIYPLTGGFFDSIWECQNARRSLTRFSRPCSVGV